MKVAQLIRELESVDPDFDVGVFCESGGSDHHVAFVLLQTGAFMIEPDPYRQFEPEAWTYEDEEDEEDETATA